MKEERSRTLLFRAAMVAQGIYLGWRFLFTLPWDLGLWQGMAGLVLALAEGVTILGTWELMVSRMKKHRTRLELPQADPDLWPEVDVFIATHNEPEELLYKTVNACMFLDYPDKRKVHVWVCDDGDRPSVAALARELGAGYLGFSGNRQAKSGNYNHALAATHAPLVATFDADMIPRSSFLERTVPYFLIPDKRVGLVQTPQSFYNSDLFQFNLYLEKDIPNEQDFFSREVNLLRNTANAAAYTGSNTVILRRALEEIGGFPLGTITEDFETSIRLQQAGYITYASEEVLAAGLSTTDVKSMMGQRVRWARGVLQSLRNTHALLSPKLSLAARLSYLNVFFYWWSFFNRLVFILAPIAFALWDIQLVKCGFWELLVFWLPSHLLGALALDRLSTHLRTMRWSQIIDTIFAPYLVLPVLAETLGIRQRKFKVTRKEGNRGNTVSRWYLLPHGILIILTLAAFFHFAAGKYGMALLYSSVILYWLGHNLVNLLYAVLFMLGRRTLRRYDRIQGEAPVLLRRGDRQVKGRTLDLSQGGAALLLEEPLEGTPGEEWTLEVWTGRYRARLRAALVHLRIREDGPFAAVTVQPLTPWDNRQWLQIIHDRPHSLPRELDPWRTVYDDLRRNLELRLKRLKEFGEGGKK